MEKILSFNVEIKVDDDHLGVPDIDEVKLQLECAILDAGGDALKEFGILDCTVHYAGERDVVPMEEK